jgi:hypothetical protein
LAGRRLGQDLLDPPNVKGWEGGTSWITSDTLLARHQILDRFLRGKEMKKKGKNKPGRKDSGQMMSGKYMDEFGKDLGNEEVVRILLAISPIEPIGTGVDRRELITDLLLDPVYQLK